MNNNQSHFFALLAALILSAVLASGCSTQAPDALLYSQTPQNQSYPTATYTGSSAGSGTTSTSAASSYIQCVNVMTAYGLQQQCYQVSNPSAVSYNQYGYSTVGFAKGISQANMQQAYVSYLSSIDANAAADMKAQYDAIIAAYTK